jgi:tetratricopeptide (TPR) repeat protein
MVRSGNFTQAASLCRKFIEQDPEDAEAYIVLGIAYASLGQRSDAIAAFHGAVRLRPSHVAAHANLGIVYLENNEMERAAAALEKAIALGDHSWSTKYNLAQGYTATGKLRQAESLLSEVAASLPEAGEVRLDLAAVRLDLGEKDAALSELQRLESRAGDDPAVREKIGTLLLKHGYYEGAARNLAYSVDRQPTNVTARLQLAEACLRAGNYRAVIRAVGTLPPNVGAAQIAAAHYLAAAAYEGSKEPSRALESYEKAVAADPKPVYYADLVKALLRAGAMEDALETARAGAEKFAQSIEVLDALGGAAMVNRVSDDALRAYRQILSLRPGDEEASLQLGNVYLTDGNFDEARERFESLSRRSPLNENARFGLALVEIRQGREAEAKPPLEEVVRLNPNHAGALYYLGKLHYGRKEFQQALEYLKRSAAAQLPNSEELSSTHYLLAQCYLKLGDRASAGREFAAHRQLRESRP